MLAAPVLAFGHDASGYVGDTHRRVGLVNVLATCAAGAVGVYTQVGGVDLDGLGLVLLGQYRNGAGAGVDAALRLSSRHALHAVATALKLEHAIGPTTATAGLRSAFYAQHHVFVAAQLAFRRAHDFGFEANGVAVAGVHAGQVGGEKGRLVTPCAGAYFHKRGARIVRVFGQQHALQFGL